MGFLWKLYKTCFSGHAEDVLAKSHFLSFQIQKPLRGLEVTPIRENGRLSIKIVPNVLFRPCGGRFDQIAFLNVSEPKIALPDWNSRQYVKTVGFVWKLYKTCFSGHAEDVLAKSHFSTFQIQKSLRGLKFTPIRENSRLSMKIVQNVLFRPCGGRFGQIAFFNVPDPKIALRDWNSRQYVKTVGFLWKLYKTCFSGLAEDVLAKSHFQSFRSKNRVTRVKFTPIRENSRLSMKIVQNVLFRECGGRFGQIALFNLSDAKSALPDWFHNNTWKQ